jgi:hypothetical protein
LSVYAIIAYILDYERQENETQKSCCISYDTL